jgi:hypothetical protein
MIDLFLFYIQMARTLPVACSRVRCLTLLKSFLEATIFAATAAILATAIPISAERFNNHIRSAHSSSLYPARNILSLMDLELHPAVALHSRAWHILVAPLPMLAGALSQHLDLLRFEGALHLLQLLPGTE